jgi:cell division septum initiation protein DivIVA
MSVYRVIDKLEASVKQGTVLPLGYRVVSEERLLELIEKLRASLPEEVGRARTIAQNGDRLVRDAQEKAQAIVSEASQAQNQLVDEQEIVRRARATAEIVLREAEQKAQRVREGADAYAASVLADLDGRLSTALGSVKKGMEALTSARVSAAAQPPAQSASLAEAAAKSKRVAFDAQHHNETAELESV